MRLKSLSGFVAVAMLLAATLACETITGGGIKNIQATANAALTQASSGDVSLTADAAQATVDAAQATADAAINGSGNPQATEANGSANATETPAVSDNPGNTGSGPDDVPIIKAENQILFASAEIVSYYTKADFDTTVKFYKDEMPKNGWTADATSSVETTGAAVLLYTKDNRQISVSITVDTNTKQTVVLATISTN